MAVDQIVFTRTILPSNSKGVVTQHNRYMDDLALQVSDAVMTASDPGELLTKFIRNIEARVFADVQSAPPQEMHDNYGLPADGRSDL